MYTQYHVLSTHSSMDEHLDCFYLLATMNNAAINVDINELVLIL